MNRTGLVLMLFFAFFASALTSYLDIPPPPTRPARFKSREQIETYLKAVKDYYDAFKIKLVRRQDFLPNTFFDFNKLITNDDSNEAARIHFLNKLFNHHQKGQS